MLISHGMLTHCSKDTLRQNLTKWNLFRQEYSKKERNTELEAIGRGSPGDADGLSGERGRSLACSLGPKSTETNKWMRHIKAQYEEINFLGLP